LQGLSRASMHPRNITLHASDGAPAAGGRQLGEGCSLALQQRDFSAAAAAAGGVGGADYAAWLYLRTLSSRQRQSLQMRERCSMKCLQQRRRRLTATCSSSCPTQRRPWLKMHRLPPACSSPQPSSGKAALQRRFS
jgi:hypothetical protein